MSELKVNSIKGVAASAAAISVDNSNGTCTLASGSKLNNCTTDGTTNLTIADGDLIIGTTGHGIDFSATANTGSSELLADYEEGYWSPTGLDGMSVSPQHTGNHPSRRYIKIGKQVHAYFDFTFGNLFNTFGARFGGLPYAAATGTGHGAFASANGYTTKSADYYLHISNSYPAIFKSSGVQYTMNEVSSNRFAGVISYTTDS